MNFNFTLDFLESYFQFNRKYLFEVILHFRPHPAGTAIPNVAYLGVYSVESFFMYSTLEWLFLLRVYIRGEKIRETYRRYAEEQVNIRIWS